MVNKYSLYYITCKKGKTAVGDHSNVDEQYFKVQVDYTQADENKALVAYRCYVTQFTPGEFKVDREKKLEDTKISFYIR